MTAPRYTRQQHRAGVRRDFKDLRSLRKEAARQQPHGSKRKGTKS